MVAPSHAQTGFVVNRREAVLIMIRAKALDPLFSICVRQRSAETERARSDSRSTQ